MGLKNIKAKIVDSWNGMTKVRHFKKIMIGFAVVFVLAAVFSAGISVGLEKARFSHGWGENYYRNFVGEPRGMGMSMMRGDRGFRNAHGLAGEIIKIDGNNVITKGPDNNEGTVLVNDRTSIKDGSQDIKITDLKVGDMIIVIGSPNDQGQIEAKFIRRGPAMMFPFNK